MISLILSFIVAIIVATVVHRGARRFVRDRLRYVDVIQKGIAPFLAGALVMLVLTPIAFLMPVIGIGTVLTAGLAAGSGVAAGVRDIRSGVSPLISNR